MIGIETLQIAPTSAPDAHVAVLTLRRPEQRNAMTPAMLDELQQAVRTSIDAGACAIALLGEGPVFCAGFDLKLCHADENALPALLKGLSHAIRALRRAPVPVVIGAHGAAIAGGCALLGGADMVVVDAACKLGYPVANIGVSPAVSGPTLRSMVGSGAARARMLDPSLIDGREALRIGLAHKLVDAGDARTEAPHMVREKTLEIAAGLGQKPPAAIRATKQWLNELDGSDNDDSLDRALGASLSLVGSDEQRARLAAIWG